MANEVRIRVVAEDKTKGVFNGVKAGMKSVVTGALALGTGLVVAMSKASEAARESAKITAQTNAVIKSTGGAANISAKGVDDLANALSRKTGIDDEVIKSGENMLLTFTNVRNEAGKGNKIFTEATKVITDMSAALGQDTKTSAIQLGKALNDPIKGITALKRVGVTFNGEQVKTITHLVKTGKTMEAQKVILAELRKEFGGSAAAQATWADKAKVAAGNIEEAFGGLVNKTFAPIGKWFVKEGAPAIEDFFKKLGKDKDLKRSLKDLGEAIRGLADKDIAGTLQDIADTLPKVIEGFAKLTTTLGQAHDAITRFEDATGKEQGGPLGGMARAVARNIRKLGNAIQDGWNHMTNWVVAKTGELKDKVVAQAGELKNRFVRWVKKMWGEAGASFKKDSGEIVDGVKRWVGRVVDWISKLPGRAKSALSSLSAKIGSEVEQAKDNVVRKARDMVTRFIDRMQDLVRQARAQAGRVKGAITDRFSGARDWLMTAGRNIVRGLNDGMHRAFDAVKKWVSGISSWIKAHKGPVSFDRQLLVPAGKALMGGLLEGLKFGFKGVGDFVYSRANSVKDIIGKIKDSMMGPAKWVGGKIPGGIAAFKALIARRFHIGAGTYPGHGAHGANRAWDFMIHSKAQGNLIAAMGRTVADLVIWNRRIWSRQRAREGWRPYTRYGPNATASQAHTNHVHVEWYRNGGWINEPIMGVGRSGRLYGFGEAGRELVTPANRVGAGNTYITVNAPNYVGSQDDLRRTLVDMNRRGQLEVIKSR